MLTNPWLAMLVTLVLCLVWMRFINLLTDKKIISKSISRKVIHIGTGPIFVFCWMIFPNNEVSKYLAAAVPLLIVLQLFLVGKGKIQDRTSILAMARSGEKAELLKGPLIYGLVFVVVTIFFWKSIHAVVALMILCGGDGIADLVGSRVKSSKLPCAKKKTIAGSAAMLFGGFILVLLVFLLVKQNFFPALDFGQIILPLLFISFLATVIESITPSDWDNITVTLISLASSLLLF